MKRVIRVGALICFRGFSHELNKTPRFRTYTFVS